MGNFSSAIFDKMTNEHKNIRFNTHIMCMCNKPLSTFKLP